jgi:hypothetical protein
MARFNKYPCPRGCKFGGETLRGWRVHMSRAHSQYSQEELAQAAGQGPEATAVTGEPGFDAYAAKMPETAEGLGAAPPEPARSPTPSPPVDSQREVLARKINAQMRKVKKLMSEAMPKLAFHQLARERGEGWELTEEEADTVGEAIETVFEAMGVDFQIEPWNVTLKSKLWLLVYPLAVALVVFFGKTMREKKDAEPDPQSEKAS